jgi:hypothetical protein
MRSDYVSSVTRAEDRCEHPPRLTRWPAADRRQTVALCRAAHAGAVMRRWTTCSRARVTDVTDSRAFDRSPAELIDDVRRIFITSVGARVQGRDIPVDLPS